GDLLTMDKFADEIASADAVIHLASPRSINGAVVLMEDIVGTGVALGNWRRGPFIYISTPAVCARPPAKLAEEAATEPEDWYQMGKSVNEFQVRRVTARRIEG